MTTKANIKIFSKSNKSTMGVKSLSKLTLETFNAIYNIDPNYMKDIFTPKTDKNVRTNGIFVKSHKTINYGNDNKTLTQKIVKFREYIDAWFGPKYKCNVCALT